MRLEDLNEQSMAAVESLLARHGWRLLLRDEYVRRTAEALASGAATEPIRAATYVYSRALYHACSGEEGPQRQELAYEELFRYLYTSAYHRHRDICEDATQQAVELVYARFDHCRDPAAFLA